MDAKERGFHLHSLISDEAKLLFLFGGLWGVFFYELRIYILSLFPISVFFFLICMSSLNVLGTRPLSALDIPSVFCHSVLCLQGYVRDVVVQPRLLQ